jgi:serine/threonine protein kinase
MTGAGRIDPSYLDRGTRVGAYEVVDKLGSGGFGCLWKVSRDDRLFALKMGRQRLSELDPEDRAHYEERLDREIAALTSLRHPNIVRVHGFEWWPDLEGFPYLVMDFVDGVPLHAWRDSARPPVPRIRRVFEKVARAIEHMHALGIFHRDLKCDNVLVRGDDEPVIIDFGIARPRLALDVTRVASVGTVTHYAPEYARYCDSAAFARGEPFPWKPTTDLHAVGYMLYQVLTGRRPFPRDESALDSEAAVLLAIKNEVPLHPADLEPSTPRELGDVVMKLLAKDPAQRPQSAAELAESLSAIGRRLERDQEETATERHSSRTAGHRDLVDAAELLVTREAIAGEVGSAELPGLRAVGVDRSARAPLDLPPGVAEPSFDAGEEEPARPVPSSGPEPIPSAVRELKARLAAGARPSGPSRMLVGGGVLAAVVVALFGMAALLNVRSERPRSTVAEAARADPGMMLAPISPAPGSSPAVSGPATLRLPPDPAPPSDAAAIDAELAREFGRPRVLPDGTLQMERGPDQPPGRIAPAPEPMAAKPAADRAPTPSAVGAGDPPWLRRSTRLAAVAAAAQPAPKPRGVPLGAHLRAKLLTNLDSRTVGSGPVEAILIMPVILRDQVIVPARTLVYGTATEAGDRFNVRFNRLRLPDDTEVEFEGLALARDDGKPGLAAGRRIQGEPIRQAGLGAKLAKGTGNILLDTVTGGLGPEIVRNAGQTALSHDAPMERGDNGGAILLDGGIVFDIWVEHAF